MASWFTHGFVVWMLPWKDFIYLIQNIFCKPLGERISYELQRAKEVLCCTELRFDLVTADTNIFGICLKE